MNKPKIYPRLVAMTAIFSLLAPSGTVFGFSYIDLGLLHSSNTVTVDTESNTGAQVEVELVGEEGEELQAQEEIRDDQREVSDISLQTGNKLITRVTRSQVDEIVEFEEVSVPMVDSEELLEAYAISLMKLDENIQTIVFADDRVEVTYPQRGRLFGFMNVTFNATAVAQADGEVYVKFPWYRFFMSDNRDEILAGVVAVVTGIHEETLEPAVAALIVSEIHAVFSAYFETEIAENGEGNSADDLDNEEETLDNDETEDENVA